MARVWEHSRQSGTHLLMLLAIADYADDDGNAYPSVTTLAAKCRMLPRNAQTILAALRMSGELEVRPNEGPRGTNLYRVVLAQGVQILAGVQSRAGVQRNAGRGAKACAKPLQRIAPEPSMNHQEPPPTARKRAAGDPEGFAEFWEAWPKTDRKQDRKKCANKWRRLGCAQLLPQILAHVEAWKGTRTWRDGYEPAPLTYLNGERWNDGMPAERELPATGGHAQRVSGMEDIL